VECNLFLIDEKGRKRRLEDPMRRAGLFWRMDSKGGVLESRSRSGRLFSNHEAISLEGSVWILVTEKALFGHLKTNAGSWKITRNMGRRH
jgi:hypothetical protein